jgi:hypothetical protein
VFGFGQTEERATSDVLAKLASYNIAVNRHGVIKDTSLCSVARKVSFSVSEKEMCSPDQSMFVGNFIIFIGSDLTELHKLKLPYYFSPLLSYSSNNVVH